MNGDGDLFLSDFELFRLRFFAAGGFIPFNPFTRGFRFGGTGLLGTTGGVSTVVPTAAASATDILAGVPTRGAPLSNQGELPMALPVGFSLPRLTGPTSLGTPSTWQEWLRIKGSLPPDWNRFPTPAAAAAGNINAPPAGSNGMALDLGNLLATLGGEFIRTKFGGGGFTGRGLAPLQFEGANGTGTPGVGQAGIMQDMFCPNPDDTRLGKLEACRVDPCTGLVTLVKRTRRRRRRLASLSDIRDLGALKAILGDGKAFASWIATRGR